MQKVSISCMNFVGNKAKLNIILQPSFEATHIGYFVSDSSSRAFHVYQLLKLLISFRSRVLRDMPQWLDRFMSFAASTHSIG